ncbi:MAG TPA: hypothetical protein VMU01_07905 [Rhizomicrobium sp.]|nr:hypothetical protein [Rhizomicrobium sp.]
MQISADRKAPSLWHDMHRDWQSWSPLERLAASVLGLGTLAIAAVYMIAGSGLG